MTRAIDLRAPALGAVAWLAALAALLAPSWVLGPILLLSTLRILQRRRRGQEVLSRLAWLVAACGIAASALLRAEAVHSSPVEELAGRHATVTGEIVVTSDPLLRHGRFEQYVVLRARTLSLTGRGQRHRVRRPCW